MSVLDSLPTPRSQRLAVRVTTAAQRNLRKRHPWLYDGGITSEHDDAACGDLAVVFDDNRKFLAIGLFDPASPIRVRVLHHATPTPIDDRFWETTIGAAFDKRQELTDSVGGTRTSGYRLLNGESDSMPGFVLDRYGSVLVLKLYSAAWIPHLRDVIPALVSVGNRLGLASTHLVIRMARNVQRGETHGLHEGLVLDLQTLEPTTLDEPVRFDENGLVFEAHPVTGQKTGAFLDQRENRRRIRDLADGASVLDVFCCSGGFSVHAAAGGARTVLAVDSSPGAIAAAERNMAANPQSSDTEFETIVGDAFEVMTDLAANGRRFDIVIVDPPSFAQKQLDVPRAMSAYRRLTHLALPLVERGGLVVQASCSSRVPSQDFFAGVLDAANEHGIRLDEVVTTDHAPDHPATFAEGRYLKAIFARVN